MGTRIPKKITPDHLIDTVVGVKFNTQKSHELLDGIISKALPEYKYNKTEDNTTNGIFFKERLKFGIIKEDDTYTLLFNFIGTYQGWELFFSEIKEVIKSIDNEKLFESITQIIIRYVSEFDLPILNHVEFEINPSNNGDLSFEKSIIHLGRNVENATIIIKLYNNVMKPSTGKVVSAVDIEVSEVISEEKTDISNLFDSIERNHTRQKETFFKSLVKDSFIEMFDPKF